MKASRLSAVSLSALLMIMCTYSPQSWSANQLARTTADILNVRNGPSGQVINKLPNGSLVAVLEQKKNWAKVLYLNKRDAGDVRHGWVHMDYLSLFFEPDCNEPLA